MTVPLEYAKPLRPRPRWRRHVRATVLNAVAAGVYAGVIWWNLNVGGQRACMLTVSAGLPLVLIQMVLTTFGLITFFNLRRRRIYDPLPWASAAALGLLLTAVYVGARGGGCHGG